MDAITVLKGLIEQTPKTADEGLRLFFAAQTVRHSLRGRTENQDGIEALIFNAYCLGSDAGDGNSACEAGKCCLLGFGTDTDYERAHVFFERGRASGHGECAYRIAHLLYRIKNDYDSAFSALDFALQSDPTGDAHYLKGQMYQRGHGCQASDEKALEYFTVAAEREHGEALFALYEIKAARINSEVDAREAFDDCLRAAEAGSIHAFYALGTLYASGLGVDKELDKAVDWYLKASNAGHGKASATLGAIYLSGAMDDPDETAASFYFEKSIQQGFDFEGFLQQMGHSTTEG